MWKISCIGCSGDSCGDGLGCFCPVGCLKIGWRSEGYLVIWGEVIE